MARRQEPDRRLVTHVADKAAARLCGRSARQALPAAERVLYAHAAAERLLALPELRDVTGILTVLAYAATPEELDPAPALAALCSREHVVRIAYPRISGPQRLTLHLAAQACDLALGAFGVAEPAEDAQLVEPIEIDVAIVPGVAFDARGARVGYGGGYYDQLLPALTRALKVGFAFDCQVFAELVTEPHDKTVDLLVTPTRTVRP